MIPAEPVGSVVARGEAEIGFQQMRALKPISGIELVGMLPLEFRRSGYSRLVLWLAPKSRTQPGRSSPSSPHLRPLPRSQSGMEPVISSTPEPKSEQ